MVYKRFTYFKRGNPTFEGDLSEGHTCASVVAKNIDAVHEFNLSDRHVTYIEKCLRRTNTYDFSRSLVSHKICNRLIPHNLRKEQKKASGR